jgi:hypothetical protein
MIDLPILLLSILIVVILLTYHLRTVRQLERDLAGALLARDTAREAAKTAYLTGHSDATNEVNVRRDAEEAERATRRRIRRQDQRMLLDEARYTSCA